VSVLKKIEALLSGSLERKKTLCSTGSGAPDPDPDPYSKIRIRIQVVKKNRGTYPVLQIEEIRLIFLAEEKIEL